MSLSHYPIQDCSDLVFEWKAFMNTIADFDDETLCCIAKTYEDDTRFKDYFDSYDNQNLASYISEAVNYFLAMLNRATIFNPHTDATTLNTPTKIIVQSRKLIIYSLNQ